MGISLRRRGKGRDDLPEFAPEQFFLFPCLSKCTCVHKFKNERNSMASTEYNWAINPPSPPTLPHTAWSKYCRVATSAFDTPLPTICVHQKCAVQEYLHKKCSKVKTYPLMMAMCDALAREHKGKETQIECAEPGILCTFRSEPHIIHTISQIVTML